MTVTERRDRAVWQPPVPEHSGTSSQFDDCPSTSASGQLPTVESGAVLHGRERELAVVQGLLHGVTNHGAALLVRGDPGAGKSSLLGAAAAAAASQDMRVLTVTGVQLEAHLPFAGLHQLARPFLGDMGILPEPQREAVRAAFGMSARTGPNLFFVALAILRLLARTASMPLLLIADDVQWLDRASCEVLAVIARRLTPEPVILLAAVGAGHPSPLVGAGLPELHLAPLDSTASRALLDASFPWLAGAEREQVLAAAEGNPLALTELPGALRASRSACHSTLPPLPPLTSRLELAFSARCSELPDITRTVLVVVAASDSGDLSEVIRAAALIGREVVPAESLAPAVRAGLIQVENTVIRFRHPLVRAAVYSEATPTERRAAHAALADILARHPRRRAWHDAATMTVQDETIADHLELAAGRTVRHGALAAAATEHGAILTGDPAAKGSRLLLAAELACDLGQTETARRLADQARPLQLQSADRTRLTWVVDRINRRSVGGQARLRELAGLAGLADRARQDGDIDLALRILGDAAFRCFWDGHAGQLGQLIVRSTEALPVPGDDPRRLLALALTDPVGQGMTVIEGVSRLGQRASSSAVGTFVAGVAATVVGDLRNATSLLASGVGLLRSQGRPRLLARALALQAWAATHLVDWDVAISAAEESIRLAQETGQPLFAIMGQGSQLVMAALRGDANALEPLAQRIERQLAPAQAGYGLAVVQAARGLSALGAARYQDAYRYLQRIFDPADPAFHPTHQYWCAADLAEAAARSSRHDQARACLSVLEAAAARPPSPWLHAGLRYARAVLADDGQAEKAFQDAMDAGVARWPFLQARTQLAYGIWLRRQRRRAESRQPLRDAADSFDVLGLTTWAARARQELRAAGETRTAGPAAPGAAATHGLLSPQELQIAEMAASGMTNREIGQQLYLSHRTVGSHLYRIFPKLGISSRFQMPDALRAAGRVPS